MGTNLNKKNEKRKNINRIIVGTRYKKRKNEQQGLTHQLAPPPRPSPKRGVITRYPIDMMTKLRHNDIGTYLLVQPRMLH